MARAKGQNRPIAPRGLVQTGYELRDLETGDCLYIPLSNLKMKRRAAALMRDGLMANMLEAAALGAVRACRAVATGTDAKVRNAVTRALKGFPKDLQNAARAIRGGV